MPARIRPWLASALDFISSRPLGGAGAIIIVLMIAAALLANFLAPYDPLANNYGAMFEAPGVHHWLGTDSFGRDVLWLAYGSVGGLLLISFRHEHRRSDRRILRLLRR